jgi:hypothetical protein
VRGHAASVVEENKEEEEEAKRFEQEKVKIKHNLADIIRKHKMKMEEDGLKMKKIKKYACDKENCLHYALVVVVILISVIIALSDITRCK